MEGSDDNKPSNMVLWGDKIWKESSAIWKLKGQCPGWNETKREVWRKLTVGEVKNWYIKRGEKPPENIELSEYPYARLPPRVAKRREQERQYEELVNQVTERVLSKLNKI